MRTKTNFWKLSLQVIGVVLASLHQWLILLEQTVKWADVENSTVIFVKSEYGKIMQNKIQPYRIQKTDHVPGMLRRDDKAHKEVKPV